MTDAAIVEALPRVFPTVVHMLADATARAPNAPALVCEDRRLNYQEYLRCVAGFAHELIEHRARGARVALICGNSLDLPIAMFAIHAAGAQAVPMNPAFTARELADVLNDAEPEIVIYDAQAAAAVEPIVAAGKIARAVRLGDGGRSLDVWRDDRGATLPKTLPAPGDLATLQYTGGTTGRPKGVEITHGQMAINISQREAALPTRADDERILCTMPLFHVFAVAMGLHLAAYCRGCLVIVPRFNAKAVLALLGKERITRLPAGPTVFIGLLNEPSFLDADFSTLRTAYSGAAALPEETLRRWQERAGVPILEGYGQSEAGPVLSYVREASARKAGSVGPALPLTEIEIVDLDTGRTKLGPGVLGEVRARGPQIMSGYRNNPVETAAALRDGWLYTGDIGEVDADGDLFIRDRKKDMAIVGGYNVYPREVDEVLFAHPDVQEAAAAGVPDPYYGETIRAFVVLKPGARADVDNLLAHCRANLAPYKAPSRIVLTDCLPRTSVGKIDRLAVRRDLTNRPAD